MRSYYFSFYISIYSIVIIWQGRRDSNPQIWCCVLLRFSPPFLFVVWTISSGVLSGWLSSLYGPCVPSVFPFYRVHRYHHLHLLYSYNKAPILKKLQVEDHRFTIETTPLNIVENFLKVLYALVTVNLVTSGSFLNKLM